MTELGDLKTQVDQLKARFSDADAQQQQNAEQLQEQLAKIKAKVKSKQDEIDRLQADKARLTDEVARLSSESQQLRGMLEDVLAAVDGLGKSGADDALSAFCAEMATLVGSGGTAGTGQDVIVVPAQPDQRAAADTETAEEPATEDEPENAARDGSEGESEERQDPFDEVEQSPALRRILRRAHGHK